MKKITSFHFGKIKMPLISALVMTYMAFHMMNGDRGLYALFKETRQQTLLEEEFANLRSEREMLERKVTLMRDDSLDLDLLDQQARQMLGMMGEGEKLILLVK